MQPEMNIELIACLTSEELFNGSSYYRACKPKPVEDIKEGSGNPFAGFAFDQHPGLNFSNRGPN